MEILSYPLVLILILLNGRSEYCRRLPNFISLVGRYAPSYLAHTLNQYLPY